MQRSHEGFQADARGSSPRRRLRLVHVSDERDGALFRAHVVLEGADGASYEGRAELPVNEQNYLRVVCHATVEALRTILGGGAELQLIGVRRIPMEGGEAILVQIASRRDNQPQLLQGAAIASASPDLDAARAVLHATNRFMIRFLQARGR